MGGTRQEGSTDYSIRHEDTESVWENGKKLVPSLASAEKQWVWVGVRPHRSPVRLEKDILTHNQRRIPVKNFSSMVLFNIEDLFISFHIKVIHNYGHGGNGVSLSWGCAVEAANLVLQESTKANL